MVADAAASWMVIDSRLCQAMPSVSIASSVGSDDVALEDIYIVEVPGMTNKAHMTTEMASVGDNTGVTRIDDDMAMTGVGDDENMASEEDIVPSRMNLVAADSSMLLPTNVGVVTLDGLTSSPFTVRVGRASRVGAAPSALTGVA